MYPYCNPLKVKLNANQCIHGIYIQTSSVDCVEIAASTGFDYVIIDEEHGAFGFTETVQMIRAAEASGITPIVRVPDHNPAAIRKALEAGAMGLYVPDIKTVDEAKNAVAAAKFPYASNGGRRGACPTIRATRTQGADWSKFVEWSNNNVMVTLLIESQEGLDNLDEILKVPGIDTIVLGRFDLAHQMGLNGDRYGETISQIFEQFVAKAQSAGVPFLTRLKSLESDVARKEYEEWVLRGARIFNLGSDREFIARAFRKIMEPFQAVE